MEKEPLSPARVRDVAALHIFAVFIVKMTKKLKKLQDLCSHYPLSITHYKSIPAKVADI
jgi:hypothetical protein